MNFITFNKRKIDSDFFYFIISLKNEPVCYSFFKKKNHFFKIITFKIVASVCYNFLKKSKSKKKKSKNSFR